MKYYILATLLLSCFTTYTMNPPSEKYLEEFSTHLGRTNFLNYDVLEKEICRLLGCTFKELDPQMQQDIKQWHHAFFVQEKPLKKLPYTQGLHVLALLRNHATPQQDISHHLPKK